MTVSPSRWLPDEPVMVISTACGQDKHSDCQTPHCGCLCHEPGGTGTRH
jgi:hypothetical protein